MDLAAYNPKTSQWLVVDWKTNDIPRDRLEILKGIYAPQIAAYVEALGKVTGCEAKGILYSTATGEVVECT